MRRNNLVQVLFKEVPPKTNYTAGKWSWVSTDTAEKYISKGYGTEWNPDEPIEVEVDAVVPKPTMANTKKEIEEYLDSEGYEYDEYATKSELLELINAD